MIPRQREDTSKIFIGTYAWVAEFHYWLKNQVVEENQPLAVIEAMKMENSIKSEKGEN